MEKLQKLTRHFRTNCLSRLKSSAASLEPSNTDNLISQWVENDPKNTVFPYSIHQRLQYSIKENSTTVNVKIEHGRKQQENHAVSLSSMLPILSKITSSPLDSSSLSRQLQNPPTPLVIEYSSPNIAKPLHMGHLRSTITGKYVARLAKFAGHKCKSITFLGDWGTQFGVLHIGILKKWDKSTEFSKFVHSLSLHELLEIYVESSKACEGDPENTRKSALACFAELERTFGENNDSNAVWSHTRTSTVAHLKSCYEKLGIKFDEFESESMYRMGCEATNKALDILKSSNILESRDDGSAFVRMSEDNIVTVLKSDNSSLYLLRDIACALSRSERYEGHSHVYVVDAGQANHFKNLFHVLKGIGMDRGTQDDLPFNTYTHVPFGRVTGMSTRSGNYVLLNDVINEGTKMMHERRLKSKNVRNAQDMKISEQLAISGLIIHALKMRKTKDYAFDWDSALTSTGNSGVALQYAVARLRSLNERVYSDLELTVEEVLEILEKYNNHNMLALVVCILNFEDSFWRSYLTVEPSVLVSYAFTLHDRVSKAYNSVKLIDNEDKQLVSAYLWVFNTSKTVLECTLNIIGMEILDTGF